MVKLILLIYIMPFQFYFVLLVIMVVSIAFIYRNKVIEGGKGSVDVKPIESLNESDFKDFCNLFTPENTQGLGRAWDTAKAAKLRDYPNTDGKYHNFAILLDGVPVGYIGISPTKIPEYPSQITYMVAVSARGRGVAQAAIKRLRRRKFGKVYSFVLFENEASNGCMRKVGKYVGDKNVFGSLHHVYLIYGDHK